MAGPESNRPLSTVEPIAPGGPSLSEIYKAMTPGAGGSGAVPSIEEIWSTRPDIVSAYNSWLQGQPGRTTIGPPGTPPSTISPPGTPPSAYVPTPTPAPVSTPLDLSALFADMTPAGGAGYRPSLVDTRAAEEMFRLYETPEESAALAQLLADLDARGLAGTEAVRGGWSQVQEINSAAAAKAAQMARDAGPEASRLWSEAADAVRNLSAQAAGVLGTTPGMQRVNISPTAGSERIAALLAAEAPRAQQLAERMGMASSEQIAAQARTAGMMGEAYAGEIQRTVLIQANAARQAHNQRVLDRVNAERQAVAQMRFQAATTNAQLLSTAAAAAAAGAKDAPTRRERILEFTNDIERLATFENVADGASLLLQIYPNLNAEEAGRLINSAKQGLLDYRAALAAIER